MGDRAIATHPAPARALLVPVLATIALTGASCAAPDPTGPDASAVSPSAESSAPASIPVASPTESAEPPSSTPAEP